MKPVEELDAEFPHLRDIDWSRERRPLRQPLGARAQKILAAAIQLIRHFHGLGMTEPMEAAAWDLYWRNAPEMLPFREVFSDDPTFPPERTDEALRISARRQAR